MFSKIIRSCLFTCLTSLFLFNSNVFATVSPNVFATVSPKEDKIIPRSVIFGDAKYINPKMSHNAKLLAYLSPSHGVLNVWVGKLGKHKSMHPITHSKQRGISRYWWAYDNEHILYMDDENGNENWRLHQVNVKNNRSKILFASKEVQVRIIALSKFFPEEILIGLNNRRADFHDVYKLNIRTGNLELVYENNSFADFVCDEKLKLIIAIEATKSGGQILYRLGKNFSKVELLTVDAESVFNTQPVGLNKTGDILYLLDSRDRDTAALTSINLRSKELKIIAENHKADVDDVLFNPSNLNPQGYRTTYTKQKWFALTSEFQEDLNYLSDLAVGDFNVVSDSLDGKKWIVEYNQSIKSSAYYYYDRAAKKAYFLFSKNPQLDQAPLTPMHTVIINSRDNLPLVSYLSVPRWVTLSKYAAMPKLPLILVVHGGPQSRDIRGYNSIHQWLANRGYAVLSVNYRGSTGFGKAFINAGNGEWGGKMQDDLVDAVDWAVNQGLTTQNQVAIFGGSYGGYATLVGLTKTPDLFVCGVDLVGPSNLQTLMLSIPEYWRPMYVSFKKMLGGDPETPEGQAFLASRSPIHSIQNINKPLLIAHGANDPRVKQDESEQIVNLMNIKHIPVTYVLYPDEGHGFRRPENRLSFFAITESFFAEHLKGRLEPIKARDLKNSSVQLKAGDLPDLKKYK